MMSGAFTEKIDSQLNGYRSLHIRQEANEVLAQSLKLGIPRRTPDHLKENPFSYFSYDYFKGKFPTKNIYKFSKTR